MLANKGTETPRFFLPVTIWTAGLVALASVYQLLTGFPEGGAPNLWSVAYYFTTMAGLCLPYASFAGGLAVHASLPMRSVVFRAALLASISYGLLAYASPVAEHRQEAAGGGDVVAKFPFGPDTPGGLRALKSAVEADPPARPSFRIDRPLETPPNWLTYLIHSLVVVAGFAILAALRGYQFGFLTSGLSPPARRNARWALGLATALAFFVAEAAGGEWARFDPANSGIVGAWLPLIVPLAELALLTVLVRFRKRRFHALPDSGVN